ncbi:MAG: DUF86 domain-containing protein [Desulfobulbaceae bacterium]|nr:DUF86 domain-containing protein [Desulfobulbaceae bacterium]
MKDDGLYRIHIQECIARIESYTKGIEFERFSKSPMVQDAVLRNLQILAESTQRLSEDFKKSHPAVDWRKISGLRNILVHDYLGIDLETVWNILARDLPGLQESLLR